MGNERHVRPLSALRVWSPRVAYSTAATVLLAALILTSGVSYRFLSNFVHMKPVTTVDTNRPEVGVLVDASDTQVPMLASALALNGMHVSFAVTQAPSAAERGAFSGDGNQAVPRLPSGGLLRWMKARSELHSLMHALGIDHHFLYTSNGPSLGQWLVARGLGGRLVAGAVKINSAGSRIGELHPGEVIEVSARSVNEVLPLLERLHAELEAQHLAAVPVGRLMRDAQEA